MNSKDERNSKKSDIYVKLSNATENLAVPIHQAHSEFCFDFENGSAEIETKVNGTLSVFPDDKQYWELWVNTIQELKTLRDGLKNSLKNDFIDLKSLDKETLKLFNKYFSLK